MEASRAKEAAGRAIPEYQGILEEIEQDQSKTRKHGKETKAILMARNLHESRVIT